MALFILITILPTLYLICSSVFSGCGIQLDARQTGLLYNTLIIGFGMAVFSIILGVFFAFAIYKTDIYFKKFLKWFYLVPILIPPYIYVLTWTKILPNWNIFQGISGAVIMLGFSYFPFVTILTISGLCSIDSQLEDAGRITHNEKGVLARITLPLLYPYIFAGGILCFVFAISNYGVPGLLQLNVYTTEIFIKFSAFYKHTEAALMAVPLIIITICLILLQKRYMKKRSYAAITGNSQNPSIIPLGKYRIILSAIVIFALGIIIFIPLITLIIQAGGWNSYSTAIKTSFKEITTSFLFSLTTATLCTIMAFFIAYIIEKTDLKIRGLADVFSIIPFAIPPTVIGIGLIKIWNRPMTDFIYGTSFILMLAYITQCSPFAVRALCSNLKQINKNIEEAALLTRANWFYRTRKILLPLMAPGLLTAWTVSFILCMRELGATLLVIPPGKETVPLKIYSLMHYGANKLVASLSIILIILTITPILVLNYVTFRKARKKI